MFGPVYISGDNQLILANTFVLESQLKKKSQIIAYHLAQEGVACDEWHTSFVSTDDNKADLLIKICYPRRPNESDFYDIYVASHIL